MLEMEVINDEWVINIHRSDNIGGTKVDVLYDIIDTADGNFVAVGQSFSDDGGISDNYGYSDVWVVKFTKTGSILWNMNYGGSDNDVGRAIIQTDDGGYVVAGYTKSADEDVQNNQGKNDYWIFKLDANGNQKWENTFGGTEDDYAFDLCETTDGGYVLAGRTESIDGDVTGFKGMEDAWIVKVDDMGDWVWKKTLGGTQTDRAYSICPTDDDGFLIAGMSDSSDGDVTANKGESDGWLVKVDFWGTYIWDKNYGGTETDEARSISRTADNGFIVAGQTYSTDQEALGNHGNSDGWVVRVDSNGDLKWSNCYGGTSSDEIWSIIETSTGGYAFLGVSQSSDGDVPDNLGSYDFLFMLLDEYGNIEWSKNYGGTFSEIGNSIIENTDGDYVLGGNTYSTDGNVSGNNGLSDCWVLQLRQQ